MPRTKQPTKRVRTKFPSGATIKEGEYILPERLERGTRMKSGSSTPCFFTTIETSRRSEFGEVLYRLKYKSQQFKKYWMPGIASDTLWTRDKLQECETRILEQ